MALHGLWPRAVRKPEDAPVIQVGGTVCALDCFRAFLERAAPAGFCGRRLDFAHRSTIGSSPAPGAFAANAEGSFVEGEIGDDTTSG